MFKITVDVDGMQCGMCENHVNEAVRGAFPVKKVSSSHRSEERRVGKECRSRWSPYH